jgi:aspartate/methionine/tyrosine aminotransferase
MTDNPQASRRSGISPFIVMDVMRDADALELTGDAQGRRIIHLEVGQPGTPAPKLVREAAALALSQDRLGYTPALGVTALRERIARHYAEAHGQDVSPSRVVITAGSSGAFILAFLACFDAGARLAISEPGYPAYRNILTALGIETIGIPVGPETRWSLTPELIARAEARAGRIDGVLVASPANPTGTAMQPAALHALAHDCASKKRWFISDEIYHGIMYLGAAETALAAKAVESSIIINSFSKYYSMTGWRLGWMVLPERMVRPVERLAQNLFISPSAIAQAAGLAAFDATPELDANVAVYAANRKFLLEELPKAGFALEGFAPADGAFYLYSDISRFTNDSAEFCSRMLREAGVAATPGLDFDPLRGRHMIRFSFAGKTDDMKEAAARLKAWL